MIKSKFSLPKIELKIGEKAAVENLMLFLQYYDIDIDILDKKTKDTTETVFNKLIKYIRSESVKIVKDEKGIKIIQNLKKGDALTYEDLQGENKISMDGYGDNEHHQKMYALAGSLCGIGEAGILKLSGQDLSAAECSAFVFLQV